MKKKYSLNQIYEQYKINFFIYINYKMAKSSRQKRKVTNKRKKGNLRKKF